jgi:hypothetical protein
MPGRSDEYAEADLSRWREPEGMMLMLLIGDGTQTVRSSLEH